MKKGLVLIWAFLFIIPSISNRAIAKELETKRVKISEIVLYSKFPAFVIAKNNVIVSSKLMGFVRGLRVDVGDKVKKGEILLKIDSKSIKEKIKQVKANLENASFNYHKIVKLYKAGVVSKKIYVAAKSGYEQAKAAYNDVLTLIGYSVIKSPINGYVTKRFVQNGDLAAPSQPLLMLEGVNIYQVQANIPNSIFKNLVNMKVVPVIIGGKKIMGELQYTQKSEDPVSHTHLVKILIPKLPQVHPGEFAEVLIKRKITKAITVSEKAIINRGGIFGVFVIDKTGKAHFRMLRLGEKFNGKFIVLAGLNPDEKVIINPPYYLVNNARIQ